MGIYVYDADKSSIKDLSLTTTGGALFGVNVEATEKFEMKRVNMSGFWLSVTLEQADDARIFANEIVGIDTELGLGITVINGKDAYLKSNTISGNAFGIWACDEDGKAYKNELYGNLIGLILCKVPDGEFNGLFTDTPGASEYPATSWRVKYNNSHDNVWGYLAIDGANDNLLDNNEGGNNAFVDFELAAVTNDLFGFETPVSHNNELDAEGLTYIDCGDDNEVEDGVLANVPCSQ